MHIPFFNPKDEAHVIPAYKQTPAGKRVGLVTLNGIAWELIDHAPVPNFTLRHVDDRDCEHPTLIMKPAEVQAWIYDNGELLSKKRVGEILAGTSPGWLPGSFMLTPDNENKDHFYGAKIIDLVDALTAQVQAAADLGPEAKASEAKS